MKTKYILFGIFLTTLIASCNNCIKGSGYVVTSVRPTPAFKSVISNGDFNIYLTQSTSNEVKIIGDDNIVTQIETTVNNDVLTITYKDNKCIKKADRLDIFISAPLFVGINLEGSGNVRSTNRLKSTDLILIVNGSGRMSINDSCGSATVQLKGSGYLTLNGEAKNQSISLNGSGNINAAGFVTKNSNVYLSGSGTVNVFATQNLYANLSGSGSIFYYGYPASVNKDVSGSGTVESR